MKISVYACLILFVVASYGCGGSSSPPRKVSATNAGSDAISTTVVGPITGRAFNSWIWPLDEFDYEEFEFFVSGEAIPYEFQSTALPVSTTETSSNTGVQKYSTRFMVYRPKNPEDFNGIAIVEWTNVSAQFDIPLDLIWAHPFAFKHGYMYITVSAQEAGICGQKFDTGVCSPTSLKSWNAERYESLEHPGDDYSFDIFSQVIQAVRQTTNVELLDNYPDIEYVIAVGQSQSAGRLSGYLCNGADTAAQVVDGFIGDDDARIGTQCLPRVPNIQLWSEYAARPVESTSSENLEIWMTPGAPHEDKWQSLFEVEFSGANNLGAEPSVSAEELRETAGNWGQEGVVEGAGSTACLPEGNAYQKRYIFNTALHALTQWITTGLKPPTAPPIDFNPTATVGNTFSAHPGSYNLDEHGNALGGMRLPFMDVPVATYIGVTCSLFGKSIPFSLAKNMTLYESEDDYISKLSAAVNKAVEDGVLLREDAEDMMRRACAFPVVGGELTSCPEVNAQSYYD
ncbi:alpha/beta hydrolase domain-containing protein [Spongiibacter thalassae]|uniref:alpha/beta hydrolase domain-containing protein n=1 Tax=Spongiibacter thalassae TaxID=2721624 RepID=UPI0031F564F8